MGKTPQEAMADRAAPLVLAINALLCAERDTDAGMSAVVASVVIAMDRSKVDLNLMVAMLIGIAAGQDISRGAQTIIADATQRTAANPPSLQS